MSENYRNVLRYVGFVVVNTAASAGLIYAMGLAPSPEDRVLIVSPITILAFVTCLCLYPILRRQRTVVRQLAAFYLAFVALTAGFGVYLSYTVGVMVRGLLPAIESSLWERASNFGHGIMGGIALGHVFGLVPFLAIVVLNGALSPLWFPKAQPPR